MTGHDQPGAARPHFGVFVPNLGEFGDCRRLVELAQTAESAGWDGFFIWDTLLMDLEASLEIVDPWIALAVVAAATTRLRIGPLLTPLARRRPWKVARETTTLDRLSDGRLVFGAGTGGAPHADFQAFGEDPDARTRAAGLDSGLDVLTRLWTGEPTEVVNGPDALTIPGFRPTPVQRPRPPVWIGASWPNRAPLRRAARWDGVFPQLPDGATLPPDRLTELVAYVAEQRGSMDDFDVVISGGTSTDQDEAWSCLEPHVRAGMTWWLEEASPIVDRSLSEMRARIVAGPPRPLTQA
jgi:alkanesulfonate monooxygenase SsuD/methylene tetrahydromethanopterin reductase-like flavin-dependent oxidoreductase (luciferase family)